MPPTGGGSHAFRHYLVENPWLRQAETSREKNHRHTHAPRLPWRRVTKKAKDSYLRIRFQDPHSQETNQVHINGAERIAGIHSQQIFTLRMCRKEESNSKNKKNPMMCIWTVWTECTWRKHGCVPPVGSEYKTTSGGAFRAEPLQLTSSKPAPHRCSVAIPAASIISTVAWETRSSLDTARQGGCLSASNTPVWIAFIAMNARSYHSN